MKYPEKLRKNGTIGVCAPSSGFVKNKFVLMCKNSEEKLKKIRI